jgi:hypothetical protein
MQTPEPAEIIASLRTTEARLVAVATGGGARAIAHLATTPGASAVVLEGLMPSAREAVDRLLGGRQESYCSPRTARRLATAAWQRAVDDGTPPAHAIGAAVVASLKTVAPKRGPHRVIVAIQTLAATSVAALELEKEARTRDAEEDVAAALFLRELDAAARPGAIPQSPAGLRPGERVERERTGARPEWEALVAGTCRAVGIGTEASAPGPGRLVFPGSFDPLHDGHRAMARLAEEIAERPVEFELSIANVDKPPLDYHEIEARMAQFAGRPLWLTRAPTFLEKLTLFPRSTFVLGADTFVRLADPRYYGGSADAAAAAVRTIAEQARGLIVFGRVRDGVFAEPAALEAPQALRDISYFVSQREFRNDISSTALRRGQTACDAS